MLKEQIRNILNASGEQWLGFLVLAAIASLITLLSTSIFMDHKVRCHYLQTSAGQGGLVYKIISDINWQADETAFKSNNEDKTLSVLSTLKQCAPK